MVYDHAYDLKAVIIAWKILKAVYWAAVLPFSAAKWICYDFSREKVSSFSIPGNICVTVRGIQHQVGLPVLTLVSWQRPPPTLASGCAAASVFLSNRFLVGTTPPTHSSQASLATYFSPFSHPAVSPSPLI